MNLAELLAVTPSGEILTAVFAYHDGITDDTQRGYTAALAELRSLAPGPVCPGALALEPIVGASDRHEAYLIQPDGTAISASLMSWTGWLAVDVPAEIQAAYAAATILGAVLWELTFYGFSAADVDARAEHIVDSALAAAQAVRSGDVVIARSREDIHKWIAAIAASDEGAELDQ